MAGVVNEEDPTPLLGAATSGEAAAAPAKRTRMSASTFLNEHWLIGRCLNALVYTAILATLLGLTGLTIIGLLVLIPKSDCPHDVRPPPLPDVHSNHSCSILPYVFDTLTLASAPASVTAALASLNATLATLMTPNGSLPGLYVHIVFDNETLFSSGYGQLNVSDPLSGAPTAQTVWRMGSNSKMLTNALLLAMRDRKLVHLDTALSDIYPALQLPNPWTGANAAEEITLEALGSHQSGLPVLGPCEPWAMVGSCNLTLAQMAPLLTQYAALKLPPFTEPQYSNLGFGLLGELLAAAYQNATNQTLPYEQLMQQLVFEPLGMNDATFFATSPALLAQLPPGYVNISQTQLAPIPLNVTTAYTGFLAPAGGMFATAADYDAFFKALWAGIGPFSSTANPAAATLRSRTWREWLTKVEYLNWDNLSGWGLGWELAYSNRSQTWLRGKNGAVPGFSTQILLMPEMRIAIFAAINMSPGPQNAYTIATDVFNQIYLPVADWVRAAQPSLLPTNAAALVGSYVSVPQPSLGSFPFSINITWSNTSFVQPHGPNFNSTSANAAVTDHHKPPPLPPNPGLLIESFSPQGPNVSIEALHINPLMPQMLWSGAHIPYMCQQEQSSASGYEILLLNYAPDGTVANFTMPGSSYGFTFVRV